MKKMKILAIIGFCSLFIPLTFAQTTVIGDGHIGCIYRPGENEGVCRSSFNGDGTMSYRCDNEPFVWVKTCVGVV